jgi:hypothetical protein
MSGAIKKRLAYHKDKILASFEKGIHGWIARLLLIGLGITLLFVARWITPFVTKDYGLTWRQVFTLLAAVLAGLFAMLILLWVVRLVLQPYRRYRQDSFGGMRFRWSYHWIKPKIVNLQAICPGCGSILDGLYEHAPRIPIGVPNTTYLDCESPACRFKYELSGCRVKYELSGLPFEVRERTIKIIATNINNGSWRKRIG